MKKRFSTFTVVIIGFLMMATGVGASELYREWAGSPDFRQTRENLSNIQTGITTLQGKLETTESDLATTKSELEKAKSDSTTKQETIDELNTKVSKLETEKENTIALIKKEMTEGIRAVNAENGPRHKYNAVKEIVNKWAVKLLPAETDRLGDHGTSEEYDEKVKDLEQAEKDMESLKNQSGKVLESLNTDTEEETTDNEEE